MAARDDCSVYSIGGRHVFLLLFELPRAVVCWLYSFELELGMFILPIRRRQKVAELSKEARAVANDVWTLPREFSS